MVEKFRDAGYIPPEERTWYEQNLASILEQALHERIEGPGPQAVEDDTAAHLFEKAKLVSDQEMQSLWARIMAGEMNAPGTFSKRTMSFVSDLSKEEAEQFTRLCGFCWNIQGPIPLVVDFKADIYKSNQVDFSMLKHLEAIGLIDFMSVNGNFNKTYSGSGIKLPIEYYGQIQFLDLDKTRNKLNTGQVRLTQIGKELFSICGSKPVPRFKEYVMKQWKTFISDDFRVRETPT